MHFQANFNYVTGGGHDLNCVEYPLFRSWVNQYYSNIDEEDWGVIMEDDASYSYHSLGHGLGPAATAATIATTSIADAGPIITTAPSYTTEGLG